MAPDDAAPRSLVVTDRRRLPEGGGRESYVDRLVAYAVAAADAGADAIQLRERDLGDGALYVLTRRVVQALVGSGCRVFVNERAHVAWAAGADGVHLRGNAMAATRVRGAARVGTIVGRSLHVGDSATDTAGVDFVLFGTVFPSFSKAADAPVAGVEALASLARRVAVPIVAIGGITVERCPAVRDAGAAGIAAIDLFTRAYAGGPGVLASTIGAVHDVFGARGGRS